MSPRATFNFIWFTFNALSSSEKVQCILSDQLGLLVDRCLKKPRNAIQSHWSKSRSLLEPPQAQPFPFTGWSISAQGTRPYSSTDEYPRESNTVNIHETIFIQSSQCFEAGLLEDSSSQKRPKLPSDSKSNRWPSCLRKNQSPSQRTTPPPSGPITRTKSVFPIQPADVGHLQVAKMLGTGPCERRRGPNRNTVSRRFRTRRRGAARCGRWISRKSGFSDLFGGRGFPSFHMPCAFLEWRGALKAGGVTKGDSLNKHVHCISWSREGWR